MCIHGWLHIGINHIGPLPQTDWGNRYIVTLVDYFSKWPEVEPIPDKTLKHVSYIRWYGGIITFITFTYKDICVFQVWLHQNCYIRSRKRYLFKIMNLNIGSPHHTTRRQIVLLKDSIKLSRSRSLVKFISENQN